MYISQTLRRAVQLNGQGTATVFASRRQTWREFEDRIACLANGLLGLGVNAGDRVAILALNSDRYGVFLCSAVGRCGSESSQYSARATGSRLYLE